MKRWPEWTCERKSAHAVFSLDNNGDPDALGYHYHQNHAGLTQCLSELRPSAA